jgi:hypothetical protein
MRNFKAGVLVGPALMAALLVSAPAWGQPQWVGSWGASPQPPTQAAGPIPATRNFANQTLRQTLRLSAGGDRLRIRLTNEYGTRPLRIGSARVGIVDKSGALRAGSERAVTFSGASAVTIPAHAPLLSDAIDLAVQNLDNLSVSLYFPEDTGPCTCHAAGMYNAQLSGPGDFTATAFSPQRLFRCALSFQARRSFRARASWSFGSR